jgi:hypothetical protein
MVSDMMLHNPNHQFAEDFILESALNPNFDISIITVTITQG